MAADAEDMRLAYSATLGDSFEVALSGASAVSEPLEKGRYEVRLHTVAGASLVWLRQGKNDTLEATAAPPSAPFTVDPADALALNTPLVVLNVRSDKDNRIAGVLDAGTATLSITRVSRK